MKLPLHDATARVAAALTRAGASPAMAESTARALVLAEAQGLGSHGLSRVAQYATHLRNGRVDGHAVARVVRRKGGAVLVSAGEGLAFPACELAVHEAIAAAREQGVAFAGVTASVSRMSRLPAHSRVAGIRMPIAKRISKTPLT